MSSNLRIDTSVDNNRLQALLAKQAEFDAAQAQLQAEIASLLPSSTSSATYHRSPIHKQHQQRRSNVPRSMSSTGVPSMSRHPSSDRIESVQQRRTLSQRSATSMARTNSRGTSSQQSGNVPFTQNGALPPTLNTERRRDNPAIMAWAQDPPLTSYTFSHQPAQLQRKPELDQVPELDHLVGGEDPGEFIYRTMGTLATPTVSISPSMSDPSNTLSNHRLSSSSYNLPIPSTPNSDSLTTATTVTSNMSRQNSLSEPLLESIQMMKFNSNASYSSDIHDDQAMYDQVAHFPSSHHSRRSSTEEQSQLLVGAGGASHESQFSHSLQMPSSPSYGEKMEKSQSNESTSSLASSSSRNVKRLQELNSQAAARPLMPKGGSEGSMSRENSSHSMTRLESKDGSQDKVAISKPTYQRPKHDRVFCKQCDSHQEGFRGEHELRRHQDREHKSMVKKWVCVEPTDGKSHPKPILALSRCKACAQQKKKYGAYYNAAAHLRRAHFKPKALKGRAKNNKGSDDEKRGGKGGGDWPPMSELKCWMKEVEEQASEFPLTTAEQEAADASDDEIDDDAILSQPALSSMGSNLNFDNTFIADNSPILNLYQNSLINNEMFGISMPLDLSGAGQTQCMDQTMYTGPTQNLFPSFSQDSYQNDQMVFYNNSSAFPQNFDDQVPNWS